MRKFYLFVFILALFMLQYAVLGVFFRNAGIPNLFVALAASLAIIFGFEKSVGWVILAGILMDAGSSWPIGSGTLILILLLWLVEKIKAVTELRPTRYFFVLLYSLIVVVSSLAFDIFLRIEFEAGQYFFRGFPNFDWPKADLNYIFKLFWSFVFGIGVYYFSRNARIRFSSLPRSQK